MQVGGAPVAVVVWAAVTAAMLTCTAEGRLLNVGGKSGWAQGVNYTVWASQQSFYVGDWLSFRYDKYGFDVLEVNQTSYTSCNADHFVTNITGGAGRDVFELKEPKSYYFICSKGYCYGGMKLAINVTEHPPPAPAPQGNRAADSLFMSKGKTVNLLALVVAIFGMGLLMT